jgi:hypothetical protein
LVAPTTSEVACRTLNRESEVAYLLLGVMPFGAALGLVVTALWSLSGVFVVMLAVAAVFRRGWLRQPPRDGTGTATQPSVDPLADILPRRNLSRADTST